MFPLAPRINLWALKGPIGAETALQRKMNYKAGSLLSKYDYKQSMVQTLFISTLYGTEAEWNGGTESARSRSIFLPYTARILEERNGGDVDSGAELRKGTLQILSTKTNFRLWTPYN